MFFYTSKILDFLLSPLTWILILMVASLLMKNKRRAMHVQIAALCVFLFFSNSFIVDEFVRLSEAPIVSDKQLDRYDAGILLGGGMVTIDRNANRLIFQQNTDRFLQTVYLYKKGMIRKILISSGSGSIVFHDVREAALLKKYLDETGIPLNDVLIDSASRNTYENAVNSAKIIRDSLPGGKFLLITSALHMARAKDCFAKQGITVDAFPTNKMSGKRRWDIGFILLPDVANLSAWETILHEWLGYLVYKIAGYA